MHINKSQQLREEIENEFQAYILFQIGQIEHQQQIIKKNASSKISKRIENLHLTSDSSNDRVSQEFYVKSVNIDHHEFEEFSEEGG